MTALAHKNVARFAISLWLVLFQVSAAFAADLLNLPTDTKMMIDGTEYRVEQKLGKGGFGVVYRMEQVGSGTSIAVRILVRDAQAALGPEGGASAAELDALFRSPSFKGAPNLLQYSEIFTTTIDGAAVRVQTTEEVIPLHKLQSKLALTPNLSTQEKVRRLKALNKIFAEGIDGIGALAENGFVHRDIKPANMGLTGTIDQFLEGKARLVIYDYDLLRKPGTIDRIAGTVAFMPPEAVYHEKVFGRGMVTSMWDVYSLGFSVFQLAAGRTPPEIGRPDIAKMDYGTYADEISKMADSRNTYAELIERPVRNFLSDVLSGELAKSVVDIEFQRELTRMQTFLMNSTQADPVTRQNLMSRPVLPVSRDAKTAFAAQLIKTFPSLKMGPCAEARSLYDADRYGSTVLYAR